MNVLVGTTNKIKIQAVRDAFAIYYADLSVQGCAVNSGVSDQPFDDETYKGAENRARACMAQEADFYVGIEGGIFKEHDGYYESGVMCIISKSGKVSFASSTRFAIPQSFVEKIRQGSELAYVIDEIKGSGQSKHQTGAIGFLTDDKYTRLELYTKALICALIPHRKREIYK